MRIGRSALVTLLVVAVAIPAHAADLTTREVVGALFKAAPGSAPNLSGKDLSRLDLAGVDFKRANLSRAKLFGTDLAGANLAKADLAGAMLDRATITRANFAEANLAKASILRPNVFSSLEAVSTEVPDFSRTNLAGAQLSGHFDLTSFRGADLTNARFGPQDPRSEVLITGRAQLASCDFTDAKLQNANLSRSAAKYAKFTRAD